MAELQPSVRNEPLLMHAARSSLRWWWSASATASLPQLAQQFEQPRAAVINSDDAKAMVDGYRAKLDAGQ